MEAFMNNSKSKEKHPNDLIKTEFDDKP